VGEAALVESHAEVWIPKSVDDLTQTQDCKHAMEGQRDALWKCSAEITRTYSAAVKMIGRIAAKVVEITSDIVNLPVSVLGELGELIQLFITEASTLLGDALERMQGYREAMSRMRGAVATLAQLVPMGHVVGDPADWEPRPAG
jgi:hypothetical protein